MSGEPWERLDRRTVLVTAGVMTGVAVSSGIPTGLGIARGGMSAVAVVGIVVFGALLLIAAGAAVDYLRWRKTFYRVTGSQVELRSGILQRKHRAVHRDRIRSVDLTANLLYRLFGVVKVSIGTGEQSGSDGGQLTLDPLDRARAEALRGELLHRASAAGQPTEHALIAQLDWRWIRYAPISILPGVLGVAAVGALWQITDWFGLERALANRLGDLVHELSVWIAILVAAAVVLAVGLIATLAFFVESWWNYRLERDRGGMLQLHRGLLIHRSLSLAEDRLRGIELVEPFGVRMAGAARLEAVATGLKQNRPNQMAEESKVLLPESPRAYADDVAAQILAEPQSPTSTPLLPHPPAARRRRLTWALAAVAAAVGVLVVLGLTTTSVLLHVAWVSAVVLGALGVFLALQAYGNLGHGSSDGYLVIRHGVLARRTVALRRSGVIGWTIRQSPMQRRAGLITIFATTAAGSAAYPVYDADAAEAVQYAADMVPGLLQPFLAD